MPILPVFFFKAKYTYCFGGECRKLQFTVHFDVVKFECLIAATQLNYFIPGNFQFFSFFTQLTWDKISDWAHTSPKFPDPIRRPTILKEMLTS